MSTFGDRLIEATRQMDQVIITERMMSTVLGPPTHWPPRPTRLAIAIRLGITRILLERKA